jgi:Ca2+-binding RTX toxin-like protein
LPDVASEVRQLGIEYSGVAAVEIYDGTTDLGPATVSGSTWSFSYNLAAGTHALYAVATDGVGHTTTTAPQATIVVDQTAPVPIISNEVVSSKTGVLTLTGTTGEANDTIAVYDGNTLLGNTTTASDGFWSFDAGKPSNVVHTYTVTATDAAGNVGLASNEAIYGSQKADALVGTPGNDVIMGNRGNDKITGGTGADVLTGGSGNVTFIYNAPSDSTPANHDTITDFTHNHDKIDFTNIAGINASHGIPTFQGKLTGSGNLTLNAHSVALLEVGGNTEVLVNTTNTAEFVSANDVSHADIEIVLVGISLGLTATDFHHV